MAELSISPKAARRWLLAQQGLLAVPGGPPLWRHELHGAAGALRALERLQCVQVDPVALVERNHQLVLQTRVSRFRPTDLDGLFAARAIFEYYANAMCVLPIAFFPRLWPCMLQARQDQQQERERLAPVFELVLNHIREHGPSSSREIGNDGPRSVTYGWSADQPAKVSGHVIDLLWLGGELMVARRQGAEKHWDLTERVLPAEILAQLPPPSPPAPSGDARPWNQPPNHPGAAEWLADRYVDAFGLCDAGDPRWGWQRNGAAWRKATIESRLRSGALIAVRVEGVSRTYYARAAAAAQLQAAAAWEPEPKVSLLPPLDNLLWRRERLVDLFGFEYKWEVYVQPAKRRFGAYTMPILEGDRFIGRIDPRLDRSAGLLHLSGLWLEPGVKLDAARRRRLERALAEFAAWHGAALAQAPF